MKVVIDTNCLISCIGKKSPFRNVFDAFLNNRFTLCVNNEIILEYEEVFTNFWGREVTSNLLGLFEVSDNFEHVQVFYKFNLVEKDGDDNKFADTYFASASDYIVSNDQAVLSLRKATFPSVAVLTLEEFSKLMQVKS